MFVAVSEQHATKTAVVDYRVGQGEQIVARRALAGPLVTSGEQMGGNLPRMPAFRPRMFATIDSVSCA